MSSLTDRERNIRQKLKDDFPHYAAKCLKVRTKKGALEPFELNEAQRILHAKFEDQIARTGMVRALVLKGRQMGVSTYTGARFYWKTSHGKGKRTFILTHKDSATQNLFAMTKRFHDNCPEVVRPSTKSSNATELDFGRLDSSYRVGTAQASGVGRSDTIQFFHGSEVAFWARGGEHITGVLQAIANEPGTESVLESTANGVGGLFYNLCQQALRGENDYELVFLPWFALPEYAIEPPVGWEPTPEIAEYARLNKLTDAQAHWLFRKNRELASADGHTSDEICWKFKQEYPATPDEAFQVSGDESFIKPIWVQRARKFTPPEQEAAPLILGIDIGLTQDKTRIIDRKGRMAGARINETIHAMGAMEQVGRIARVIDRMNPARVFIDVGGVGAGIVDRLREMGYRDIVTGVDFGSKASDPDRFMNKRAEMWGLMRDWLMEEGGVGIVDDDGLHRDLVAPQEAHNSTNRIQLERKDEIRKRLGFSPDAGDALALTFAFPVRSAATTRSWTTAVMDESPFS